MDKRFLFRWLRYRIRRGLAFPLILVIVWISGGIIFAKSAAKNDLAVRDTVKILWVVDGVPLNDSVFEYTLDQMKSDSSELIAALSLRCFERMSEIRAIEVLDSLTAVKQGFRNCNGVVKIQTLINKPVLIVVNGYLHESRETISGGDMLQDNGKVDSIITNEVKEMEPYGIKSISVLRDFGNNFIGCRQMVPIVVVTTERPYYHYENLIGHYEGKAGGQKYDLKLNSNFTYVFTRQDKNSILGEVMNSGSWKIEDATVYLMPGSDREEVFVENFINLDPLSVAILPKGGLKMPKSMWSNKKSVKLKITHDDTD